MKVFKILRRRIRRPFRKRHFFLELNDSVAGKLIDQAIPPIVYQTAKNRLVDDEQATELMRFRALNDDLSFVFFDDKQMLDYMDRYWADHPIYGVFLRVNFPQMRADIFRYCLLFERGGYYFDFNKAAFTRISDFHNRTDSGVITYERNECIVFPDDHVAPLMQFPTKVVMQWSFGFAPQHPFLQILIDRIVDTEKYFLDVTFSQVREAIFTFTGPGLFTWAFRAYLEQYGASGIAQAGIEWGKTAMFRVRGAHRRIEKPEHYAALKNRKIVESVQGVSLREGQQSSP